MESLFHYVGLPTTDLVGEELAQIEPVPYPV